MSSQAKTEQSERRAHARFSVKLRLRYRVLFSHIPQPAGHGTTVKMSSHGILFTDGHVLPRGAKVDVEIDWPVKLDGRVPLKLIIHGSVIRSEAVSVALEIRRHEFRICKPQMSAPS